MKFQIIPKQQIIPEFDPKGIAVRHISYFDFPYTEYEQQQITEQLIQKILQQIPKGLNLYLSLDPNGEDDWLEVNCDGEWIALSYSAHLSTPEEEYAFSYHPEFAGSEEMTPLNSGGQSPIEKELALQDIQIGVKAVEYFIRTGLLYPGIEWARELPGSGR